MATFNTNTKVADFYGQTPRQSPAAKALKGLSPNQVPYSEDEHRYAAQEQAQQLADRESIWEQQERGPFAAHTQSPLAESKMQAELNPAWAAFGDAMAQAPLLAQGRGMKGSVNLTGGGPGSGSGIGSLMSQTGNQIPVNLDTLADDATSYASPQNNQLMARQALAALTRGGR